MSEVFLIKVKNIKNTQNKLHRQIHTLKKSITKVKSAKKSRGKSFQMHLRSGNIKDKIKLLNEYNKQFEALEYLESLLDSGSKICGDTIAQGFVDASVENSTHFVYSFDKSKKDTENILRSFCLFERTRNEQGTPIIYISLICSNKVRRSKRFSEIGKTARYLLEAVYKFAEEKGIPIIRLNSVPFAINYYKRQGFKITNRGDYSNLEKIIKKYKTSNNLDNAFRKYNTTLVKRRSNREVRRKFKKILTKQKGFYKQASKVGFNKAFNNTWDDGILMEKEIVLKRDQLQETTNSNNNWTSNISN